ncbi:hypothetical protein BOH72_16270 [Mycobacterium sp. WY10]|nr:hypothetical protein BOH72_16270 [Mycobacterium sp. WY10]
MFARPTNRATGAATPATVGPTHTQASTARRAEPLPWADMHSLSSLLSGQKLVVRHVQIARCSTVSSQDREDECRAGHRATSAAWSFNDPATGT